MGGGRSAFGCSRGVFTASKRACIREAFAARGVRGASMTRSIILQILKVRWRIVVAATVSAVLGATLAFEISQPRYEASARVRLDFLKMDPITGVRVPSKMMSAYIASQLSMVRDIQVVGPAAQSLGLFQDPEMVAAYAARDPSDGHDLPAWVALTVLERTAVRPVQESNLLEITYQGGSPESALAIVDAIRQSYYDAMVAQRRESAAAKAHALSEAADHLRTDILRIEAEKRALEQQYGVLLDEAGNDLDSRRLSDIAGLGSEPVMARATAPPELIAKLLSRVDQQLAERTSAYGPNHPLIKSLMRQREDLLGQISAATSPNNEAVALARLQAEEAAISQLKSKVLSNREAMTRIKLLHDELDEHRRSLEAALQQMMKFRELSVIEGGGVTIFGAASVKADPVFPNALLMVGGGGALGLMIGVLTAILTELWDRRVWTVAGLQGAVGAPVLGAIPDMNSQSSEHRPGRVIDGQMRPAAVSAQ